MQHVASQHRNHPGHRHIVQLKDVLCNDNYVFEVMCYYNGGDLFSRLNPAGTAVFSLYFFTFYDSPHSNRCAVIDHRVR